MYALFIMKVVKIRYMLLFSACMPRMSSPFVTTSRLLLILAPLDPFVIISYKDDIIHFKYWLNWTHYYVEIGCSRNTCIFEDIKHFFQDIGVQVFSYLHHILKAFSSHTSHICQELAPTITWLPPSVNSIALNDDGSVFLNFNMGGFDGLIHDHKGYFCMFYYGKLVYLALSMLWFWVYNMI